MNETEMLPVEIIFTDGSVIRCRENRCYEVDGAGRLPVDDIGHGDVIRFDSRHVEWKTVDKVNRPNKKAALSVGADLAAEEIDQFQYSTERWTCK